MIATVPVRYPGGGRRVYPGFLQVSAFLGMNLPRHVHSHMQLYRDLVNGDAASAAVTKAFYDEYFAVLDMRRRVLPGDGADRVPGLRARDGRVPLPRPRRRSRRRSGAPPCSPSRASATTSARSGRRSPPTTCAAGSGRSRSATTCSPASGTTACSAAAGGRPRCTRWCAPRSRPTTDPAAAAGPDDGGPGEVAAEVIERDLARVRSRCVTGLLTFDERCHPSRPGSTRMTERPTVAVEAGGPVARITLDHPERRNALGPRHALGAARGADRAARRHRGGGAGRHRPGVLGRPRPRRDAGPRRRVLRRPVRRLHRGDARDAAAAGTGDRARCRARRPPPGASWWRRATSRWRPTPPGSRRPA